MGAATKTVTDATFADEVLEPRQAGHRRLLGRVVRALPRSSPILDEIAAEHADKIDDRQAERRRQPRDRPPTYGIIVDPDAERLPQSGELVKQIVGAKPKAALLSDLAEYL